MCSIAGEINLTLNPISGLDRHLDVLNSLQKHRGPDGTGQWSHPSQCLGFGHNRLAIIDPQLGIQPMTDGRNWLVFNGEIYNFEELRRELGPQNFRTHSDSEVILKAYEKWGKDCVKYFRGMFAFALWDESERLLFCARDRFGIKPFYFTRQKENLIFASEAKALLPFLPDIATNPAGLKEYLFFQFNLNGKTLFQGIDELQPAHCLILKNGAVNIYRYWDVQYEINFDYTDAQVETKLKELFEDSVKIHMRADVPIGAYVSGGFDSSLVASVASSHIENKKEFLGFTGRFNLGPQYDESFYAKSLGDFKGFPVEVCDIELKNLTEFLPKVIYHLDYPMAGPGSFAQYMISGFAAKKRKVVLGGQGGDEMFGGYTRYLIAYFEQVIKAAIDGTMNSGNFIVSYQSILPNLSALKNYKGMLQEFWKEGLFDSQDKRYFRLINRSPDLKNEVRWDLLKDFSPFETFKELFYSKNVKKESYLDSMTHFDFKTLLPALLHVEDRMSMAHGLESRVPFLDQRLVEFAATLPSTYKFKDGTMKYALQKSLGSWLPPTITNRKDKMGFPVPFVDWANGIGKGFVQETLRSTKARSRDMIDNDIVAENLESETQYGRKLWGFLSLELWQNQFHDRKSHFHNLIKGA